MLMLLACLTASAQDSSVEATAGASGVATEQAIAGDEQPVDAPAEPLQTEQDAPEDAGTYPLRFDGQATPESSRHWELEVAYYEGRNADGLALAKKHLAADAKDAEAAWHIVRFMYEMGEADNSLDKLAWYKEMARVADEALEHNPGDRHLHFARGVANGRYGTTRGVIASLFLGRSIETDWLTAADGTLVYSSIGGSEQLPCDAYHALGIFYRLVPEWWIIKVLAGTRGDLDKSLSFHEQANERCPNRVWNLKELGATALCIGTKRKEPAMTERGLVHLQEAIIAPGSSGTSVTDREHAQMLLDDPSLACEYSRDGQQDLDEQQLKQ
jgi:hypothetical protein